MSANKFRLVTAAWCVFTGMLFCSKPAFSGSDANQKKIDHIKPLSAYLSIDYSDRSGELKWNIASDKSGNKTPNILSEITFADLEIEQIGYAAGLSFNKGSLEGLLIEASYGSGDVDDGLNRDSDYARNNRKGEYSRSHSDADGSEITNYQFSLGYRFALAEAWTFTPKFGYSFNEQAMKMTNGVQIIDTRVNGLSLGTFPNTLNSSYTAEWEGFWLGGDLTWQRKQHQIRFQLQAHFQDYYAEANWNLREDFKHPVSFAQWADGQGNRLKLQYQYQFSKYFSVWLEASTEDFEATDGRDVVYFANGKRGATKLNKVNWDSQGYSLGLKFSI